MKKSAKISLIVTSSVVGAILIAVIVLCSVSIRPMKQFMNYDEVRVTTNAGTLANGTLKSEYKSKLDKNLKKTGFSVMHATLEFVGSYGPKFVTVKNEDDETVKKEVTVSEAKAACAATADSYYLQLDFAQVGTYKVGKETVEYDTLLMNVKSTDGELRWVEIYLYRRDIAGNQSVESDEYRITPILVRMNTSPLYIALGEIAAEPIWGLK